MLMPPSLGGTMRCTSTSRPAATSALLDDLAEPRVLEHAAAERDGGEAVLAGASATAAAAAARPIASWNAGGEQRRGHAARRGVDERGHERRRVDDDMPASSRVDVDRVRPARSPRGTDRASASSSMAAWAS